MIFNLEILKRPLQNYCMVFSQKYHDLCYCRTFVVSELIDQKTMKSSKSVRNYITLVNSYRKIYFNRPKRMACKDVEYDVIASILAKPNSIWPNKDVLSLGSKSEAPVRFNFQHRPQNNQSEPNKVNAYSRKKFALILASPY